MRKVLIVGMMIMLSVVANSFAFTIKVESEASHNEIVTDIHLYYSSPVAKGFSTFVYSLTGESYSEAYAGVGYAPLSWLSMSIGGG